MKKEFELELDLSEDEQIEKDTNSNEVWVTGFDAPDAISFIDKINSLFEESPDKPIVINICSPGGTVYGLFAMLDAMDSIRGRASKDFYFVTYAVGAAMSSGCDLLAHGDLRIAAPNATMMVHQTSEGDPDADRQNWISFDIFRNNTGFEGSTEDILHYFVRAKYFDPKEALDFGIIDDIGTPVFDKRGKKDIILVKKPKGRRNIRIRRR